jgi:hypothetical protein
VPEAGAAVPVVLMELAVLEEPGQGAVMRGTSSLIRANYPRGGDCVRLVLAR